MAPESLAAASIGRSIGSSRIAYTLVRSSLGSLLLAGTRRGICHVAFVEGSAPEERVVAALALRFPFAVTERDDERLASWAGPLVDFVEGRATDLDLPLDVGGTRFQQEVWNVLRRIPQGETRSYGQIARELGRPRAARAVARACAQNPVALVIPCHRVVPSGGGVGGYAWGSARKRTLLEREGGSARPTSRP